MMLLTHAVATATGFPTKIVGMGLLVASIFVGVSAASANTIIDSFEEGPFSVTNSTFLQSGLSTSNVASGQREVVANAATADLVLTGGDDSAIITGVGGSTWAFAYDFTSSPFDITSGETQDRVAIEITAFSGSQSVGLNLSNDLGLGFPVLIPVTSIGTLIIPFSSFPGTLDLTQLQSVRVIGTFSSTGSLSISNVATVPEPSTAFLLGIGFLGLARCSHRSRGT